MGVEPGPASASAMRAMDEPMTRAICTAVSVSTRPTATIDWNSRAASMSRSVKTGSSSPTSRKPRARQKRRAVSMGMSVVSATSTWVMRRSVGNDQAVDHEEVDDVVGDRPVDLLVGAAQVLEQAAHPDQRVVVRLTGAVLVVRHGHTLPGAWRCARGRRGSCPGRVPFGMSGAGAHPAGPGSAGRAATYTGAVAAASPRSTRPGQEPRMGPRAVLIPVKAFHQAKRRLHLALSGPERAELSRAMADRVLGGGPSAAGGGGLRRQRRRRMGPGAGSPGHLGTGTGPERRGRGGGGAPGVSGRGPGHGGPRRPAPCLGPDRGGRRHRHHPGARPLRQRDQRHGPAHRRPASSSRTGRAPSPAIGPRPSAWGFRCGSSTGRTWPGTSTSQTTWCRWR